MTASGKDSVRSRAVAGICYVAVGGVICAVALMQIRFGVRTIPYRSGQSISLEMVAGIAGIVVFMGFVQLVLALILKLRGRQ